MNLCIDQGNSSTKVGVFNQNNLIESFTFTTLNKNDISSLINKFDINACILSSVIIENEKLNIWLTKNTNHFINLSHNTPVPITNLYKTPESLGKDRLAAVIGASFLKPETDLLIIDAGTAITYDFIDSNNNYHGGNIAPGLDLRLRSLHEFTKKLPLVSVTTDQPFLGNDTNSALVSGAVYGIVFEIDGYINTLKIKYPQLSTFLTGGSIFYFDNKLKNAIFADKNLVLIGLNRILQYNV
ncbi:MAG: type III pantothenate kinase [Paludibacter sp.]|nr:type III pantothenate kinase [Paludibacter sp.]